MTVLKVKNIKKGNYSKIDSWSENIGISKGISIDGKLAQSDIDKATQVIAANLLKIQKEYLVLTDNIFVVGSSGVAMASNTDDLIDAVYLATNKKLVFINAATEGEMLLKGSVPPRKYRASVVLDIGGGNTKGGYSDSTKNKAFAFSPLSLNYGTVTLTELILKQTKNESVEEFIDKSDAYVPTLREQIQVMFAADPIALEKENIYLSGGAIWAFYSLTNGASTNVFSSFTIDELRKYDEVLKTNFQKFETLAKTDKEAAKVLKTYSQKYLISASTILLTTIQSIPNIDNKKLFFAKEGQIAWLVSYVADRAQKK